MARASALAVVWLGGLAAGFFALLSVAARYTTCSTSAHGLACRPVGTAIGGSLVIGVIATVTAATVLTHDRGPRRSATWGVLSAATLAACYLAAHALLGTA
ncbi:MAG: hypothetical protein QOF87_2470 [Pseudonocardiales bacterium]|nr:hypothetical protein [Pseudonocardiales bacterium]MDT4958747.1 hypothetical protein [Pseudonocardiales bacterium]MDT4962823.1 hypothetical protein [Pseudonocardiales bacterium]MDT4972686.1 hypothetical protein [Pseudonocardiales bacterium]MDT4976509.1 hypothetical protein [Pseudonocardiales bacterium]